MRISATPTRQFAGNPLRYLLKVLVISMAIIVSTVAQEKELAGFTLEEVVVTARKVEENLQNTPLAVTAITGDLMTEKGVEQITAVANIAPNVNFSVAGTASGTDSAAVIFIRGIGQNDFTLVTDPGVSLYVDGVYYSRTIGSVLDVFDLERIEVLRGPQGTLFGRNSTGGAINLTSKKPSDELGGRIKAIAGDNSRREVFGSLNLPINEDFGLLFSALTRSRNGSASDASGRELGDDDMFGGRVKGLWQPNDGFSLNFSVDYVSEDEGSAAEVPLVRNASGSVSSSTNYDFTPVTAAQGDSINDTEAFGIAVTAEWRLNDSLLLKSVTGYRGLESTFARTPSSATNFSSRDDYEHDQFSQEIQWIGSDGMIDYVAGLFYMMEDGVNSPQVDVAVAPTGWPRLIGAEGVENENWAIFGETTWNFSEETRIITGARFTDETKKTDLESESIPGVTRGTTAADPVLDYLAFEGFDTLDYSEVTWRVALQHDLKKSLMGYVSISRGFKSGGFEQRLVGGVAGQFTQPDTFLPEFVDSYEVGIKSDFDHLRLNVALFYSDYTDLHVSGNPPGSIATETFNGGEATIQGLEIELTWVPSPEFLFDVSLGILDAKYDEIDVTTTSVTVDDELIRAPKHSLAIGASYIFDLGETGILKARIDIIDKGETHFEANNSSATFEDGYTSADANIAYISTDAIWTVRIGVNNLTNERYLIAGDANTALVYDLGVFARERNYYLSTERTF